MEPEIVKTNNSLDGLNVLCVDDEIDILTATEILLTDMGCEIVTAMDIQEVKYSISDFQPDIVIADFRLANNLNGIHVINTVRERYPRVAALLLSGDTDPTRIQEAAEASVKLLTKPVNKEELQREIAKAVVSTHRS